MNTLWGIHNDTYGSELIENRFISIDWWEMGDLTLIGNDRERLKAAVRRTYPRAKAGAIPVWAGVLRRFAFDMQVGDLVVAPNRSDGTLTFGRITGPYQFLPGQHLHPHRRSVTWLRTGAARSLFSQSALYEIGSAMTLFQVRKHAEEFLRYVATDSEETFVEQQPVIEQPASDDDAESRVADEPSAERIEQHARDFLARTLLTELSHEEFEQFTADLLRCLGYQARVTQFSGDGGVDVIAHKDALGLEPPIIKVQCKHTSASQGRPAVQQLIGTLAHNEAGLFVTLGSFTADALAVERERQNLRLYSGADITDLTLRHYDHLPRCWRERLPLRRVLVVDRDPERG